MPSPESTSATTRPAPRRRRRWSFVITALLLGLVLALVLVELAFRLFWQMPPNFAEFQQAGMYVPTDDGGAALRPGYRGSLRVGDSAMTTTVAINQLGLRGPEITAKQPGERRVLVVGDSVVFGYGVEADEALPAQLEQGLRQDGAVVTCGNAGVISFGTSHAAAHLARLAGPFAADALVFCGYLGNDAMDDVTPVRRVYAGQLLQTPMAQLVQTSWRTRLAIRSRAALWFETWVFTNRPAWSPLLQFVPDPADVARVAGMPPGDKSHAGLFLDVIDPTTAWAEGAPPVVPRVLANLRASLERAKAVAGERPLWFVVLPTLWQVDEARRVARLKELQFDPAAYQRGLAQQRWVQVAKDLGITALDSTPILAAEPDPAGLFIEDGGHFSKRGNQLVGRWLAREVAARLK